MHDDATWIADDEREGEALRDPVGAKGHRRLSWASVSEFLLSIPAGIGVRIGG
jgi:hypothetical protein